MKNTSTSCHLRQQGRRRRRTIATNIMSLITALSLLLLLLLRDVVNIDAFTIRSLPLLGRKLEQRQLRKQQQQKQKQLQDETMKITTATTTSLDEDSTDGSVTTTVAPNTKWGGPRRRVTRVTGGIASTIRNGLSRLPRRRIESQLQEEDISDVATASAGLYMNPETATMASNIKVTWEPDAAMHIRNLYKVSNPTRPLMIGVVGIPGSGKSTSCDILAELLQDGDKLQSHLESKSKSGNGSKKRRRNNNGKKNNDTSLDDDMKKEKPMKPLVMPMDGYHYSMAQLLEFPNAEDAIYRRGACDTFDSEGLARDLERIAHGLEPIVQIPGYVILCVCVCVCVL